MRLLRKLRLIVIATSAALLVAACSGAGPTAAESNAAEKAATQNQPQLQLTTDLATTQLLDVSDGTIADLSTVITGDRPVLLWYWAPL